GAFLDDRQHLLAGDGVAFGELDLLQYAVDRRGDLEHDLVGLQVDQVLIAADGIPDLLVPAGDGGVGHGFGKDRDFDFGGHGTASLMLWGRAVLFGGDLVAGRVDQGLRDQPVLFLDVVGEMADGGRGRAAAAGVAERLALGQAGLQVV